MFEELYGCAFFPGKEKSGGFLFIKDRKMVTSNAVSHNLVSVVKVSRHLPFNPNQIGFTHPWSSTSSGDSGRSERFTDAGTGDTQEDFAYTQLPAKCDRLNGRKYLHNGSVCMWRNGKICCEHGRTKSRCKECGGSAICEHGRRKRECKECVGSAICEHGRRKRECKECGGSGICEHSRVKSVCKECGGSVSYTHLTLPTIYAV